MDPILTFAVKVTIVPFQTIKTREPDRTKHVWYKLPKTATYKCVLCGGVSRTPTDDDLPEKFEPLTDERDLCPNDHHRKVS